MSIPSQRHFESHRADRIGGLLPKVLGMVGAFIAFDQASLLADSNFADAAAVMAKHCVRCHNEIDREGDFSLQTSDSLQQSDFVQPGDLSSHLLTVVQPDGDQPPSMPKEAEPLSKADLATLKQWIESGATWPDGESISEPVNDFDWWSFQPITNPSIPKFDAADLAAAGVESDWADHPIDAFAFARFQSLGLTPAKPADRRTLIRRLTYDLIGLPPTPEEVDAFVSDSSADAYPQLVDRLLKSKHYGERWARHWLDVVKYADTCGYDKDKLRPNAWPYRDYVIQSLNDDKPYGRFVQEQIAGDVLFPGDPQGILGLGFIAAGPWDFIGHVEVSENKIDGKVARNLDRDEMVSNTINAFCSVTIQCARCHNHKFDPFTQEHYYSLQAVFAAVDRADRVYQADPKIAAQRTSLEKKVEAQKQLQQALDAEIATAGGTELETLNQQSGDLTDRAGLSKDPKFGFHSAMTGDPTEPKWVQIDIGDQVDATEIVLHACHDDFGGIGAGFGFPVQYRVEVSSNSSEPKNWQTLSSVVNDAPNPGLTPVVIEADQGPFRFVRLTATQMFHRVDTYMFALAELQVLDADGTNHAKGGEVTSMDSIEAPPRWAKDNLVDGQWAKPKDAQAFAKLTAITQKRDQLASQIETPDRIARRKAIRKALTSATKRLDAVPAGKLVYAAATEFEPQSNFKPTGGQPRMIRLLHRGNVDQPLQTLAPGRLPIDHADQWRLSADMPEGERRAALAKWLTDKDNPLVWRSIVNRIWQYHFGTGIVPTANDFGRMGIQPTDPKLLDWLAVQFRDGDQSWKQLHRMIVTSNLYRQSSEHNASNAAIDGSNQSLWRVDRRRLSAEEIRDSVLAVSGTLDRTMGGPGFYLFELEKTEHSPHYEYHKFDPSDAKSHRRSIYRFIVRSQPDPYMTTLDCADSSQSTPKRIETLTSLQALALLNNRFNLEMARRFADRLRAEHDDPVAQLERAMKLICGRPPTISEQTALTQYGSQHGLENLCRMLLNLSEFVYLD